MCNNNNEINAKEFLLFSYFKIMPQDAYKPEKHGNLEYKKFISIQCAYRAYLDLNRTLTVNKKTTDKIRKNHIYGICNQLINNIYDKLFYISNDGFDIEHRNICESLKNQMNNNSELLKSETSNFSVGQAQKWLNMTLKYMWLLGLLENKIKTEYLHVPVDSYIIKAVWKNENITLPIVKKLKNGSRGAYSSEKVIAWSKWDYEKYIDFQNSIKEDLGNQSRIEWEHTAWMEFAE